MCRQLRFGSRRKRIDSRDLTASRLVDEHTSHDRHALISQTIGVAFAFSLPVTFGFPGSDLV